MLELIKRVLGLEPKPIVEIVAGPQEPVLLPRKKGLANTRPLNYEWKRKARRKMARESRKRNRH